MFEEPYRWVEAVENRRQYLDEQFRQGSPVVALSYEKGILLLTVSRGTPKLYEIYDRIGLGGMGHPADLEKLRFSLLEMAHLEGFNRSPSDVTGSRLVKYGLAPVIKQAFEEIFKAPFIVKMLLAELGHTSQKDCFLTINYDGAFEEGGACAALASTSAIQAQMVAYVKKESEAMPGSLPDAMDLALRAWALGSLAQLKEQEDETRPTEKPTLDTGTTPSTTVSPDRNILLTHLRAAMSEQTIESAILERNTPGSSRYRPLDPHELTRLLPKGLPSPVN